MKQVLETRQEDPGHLLTSQSCELENSRFSETLFQEIRWRNRLERPSIDLWPLPVHMSTQTHTDQQKKDPIVLLIYLGQTTQEFLNCPTK